MVERITQSEFRQMRSSASGRKLSDVAAAAMEWVGEAVKTQPAPSNARKPQARGRLPLHKNGEMNKTEAAYAADVLERRKQTGEVVDYWFERFTFKLADDCRYTPDFVVMLASGELECHETKGYWQDDAKVKIRVAASLFPFRFVAIQKQSKKDGGGWTYQEF